MKKIIAIICSLSILTLTACNNHTGKEDGITALSASQNSETEKTFLVTDSKTDYANQNYTTTTQNFTKEEKTSKTVTATPSVTNTEADGAPPYVLRESLDDLKQIKLASETMSESEFAEFMDEKFSTESMNGINSLETANKVLQELEETYIPLLDNDEENFSRISFYHEKNEIYQLISFDDETRLSTYVYTPENNREKKIQFSEESNITTVQSVKIGEYNVNLYEVEDADYSFFADVIIYDTYIIFKGKPNHSFEEYKAVLNRLTFVKIGDLLI